MKKILAIVVFGLVCFNTTFAADNIKPKKTPLKKPESPYGNTKKICESILEDKTNIEKK